MSDYHDWNQKIVDEFRANDGRVGGQFEGAPILVLHTKGRKSGERRINPMMYLSHDGRIFVFASKAGAPSHPDWFHNLVTTPHVTVELGTETFAAHARPVEGAERDRIYAIQAELRPTFAEYQEKTTRTIPVVELVREGK
jgi:deazaflavin-dependent oxidoreductase (nitroreductase family)